MRILELIIENLKNIKVVRIKPDENMVKIVGKNGHGKSSILDSIEYALGGTGTMPPDIINHKKDESKIIIKVGEYVIKRKITKKGSYLSIEDEKGRKIPSPQSFLDDLIGNIAFDPMEFMKLKPDARLQLFKNVAGINTNEIDEKIKSVFDQRTYENRKLNELSAVAKEFRDIVPVEPVDIVAGMKKLEEQKTALRDLDDLKNNFISLENKNCSMDRQIKEFKDQILDLKERKDVVELAQKDIEEEIDKFSKADFVYKKEIVQAEIKKISELCEKATEINLAAAKYADKQRADQKTAVQEIVTKDLNILIESLRTDRMQIINTTKIPIDGLTIEEGNLVYKGSQFVNLCQSEQIKISMAMAMAINPKIKVVLVREGSLLDDDSMAIIENYSKEKDYQIWIEIVKNVKSDGDNSIFIYDGEVNDFPYLEV